MSARARLLLFGWIICACAWATGCGDAEDACAVVRGRVLYRGEPVRTGTIVLIPDQERGTTGPMAVAELRADGSFELTTEGKPGAVPGWHRVTIASPMSRRSAAEKLPAHYADPDLSDQIREVKPGVVNEFTFRLD